MSVYLTKNGGTDADSWRQEVYHRDLLQYAIDEDTHVDVEDFINSIEDTNLFFVWENERVAGKPHLTRIVSPRGSSLVSARFEKNRPVELRYEVIEGADEMPTVFAISGPGLSHGVIRYSRAVDILPTFLHLMGKEISPDDFHGIVLPLTR